MRYAVLALTFFATIAAGQQKDDTLYWFDNYSEAVAEAKSTGKPIFLEFRCEA